jgi:CheY-like chemotaxis protein
MARILCVDDESAGLMLLDSLLSHSGHVVFTAHDGIDALVGADETEADVVVTDILMPRMDGYRLSMEFRKDPQLYTIPFIFYTASYTEPADEELAERLGAARFVRKPEEPKKLLRIIEEVLASESTNPPLDETDDSDVHGRY